MDDSFDDLPKLIRLAPNQTPVKTRPQPLQSSEISSPKVPKKNLDNILIKQGVSEAPTPTSNSANRRPIISDQQLRKTEKGMKIQRTQMQISETDKALAAFKNTDRSKSLISQMVNKIAAKNIAEELLPISSETINKLINEIEIEKAELVDKAMSYQLQLSSNPHNKNLQKELEILQKGIDRFNTIKLLYIDKVELRNQNLRLLGIIEDLKKENKEIKAKIAQGIQQIEAHMHNLPCDKEKALAIEIRKYEEQLKQEREMRINLQRNVSNTIQNFTRLYEQADLARKIIVGQLKQIESLKNTSKGEDNGSDEPQFNLNWHQLTTRQKHTGKEHSKGASSRQSLKSSGQAADILRRPPTLNHILSARKIVEASNADLQQAKQKTARKHKQPDEFKDRVRATNVQVASTQKKSLEDMVNRMRGNQKDFAKGSK